MFDGTKASGVKPDVITFNAFVSAYGKAGKLQESMLVFDESNTSGVKPNVVIFSSLTSACGKTGKVEEA